MSLLFYLITLVLSLTRVQSQLQSNYPQPLDLCTGCLQCLLLIIFHDSTATFSNRPALSTFSKVTSPLTQWPYHFYHQDLFYFIH